MINSKRKGAAGERELAAKLREYGFDSRRSVQYCGANGDADVLGLPGIHIECKRTEKLNLYDAMAQAKSDCKENIPAVFHRRNNCEWLVILRLEDFIEIYRRMK
jgi:Holliday junction resolvase